MRELHVNMYFQPQKEAVKHDFDFLRLVCKDKTVLMMANKNSYDSSVFGRINNVKMCDNAPNPWMLSLHQDQQHYFMQ